LLAGATIAFRERDGSVVRCIAVSHGNVDERCELSSVSAVERFSARRLPPLRERQRSFDAAIYDRLRVVLTELRRILDEGGDVALRLGTRLFGTSRLAMLMRGV
jgi:hypothetical protein